MATLRKDGRWQSRVIVKYENKKPVYKVFYAKTEAIANKIANDYFKKYVVGSHQNITVEEYSEKYLTYRDSEISARTKAFYRDNLRLHILPLIGEYQVDKVNVGLLKNVLLEARNKGLGERSVQIVYTIMSLIFKEAYVDELIDSNPMDRIKRPKLKKTEKTIIDKDIFFKILEKADQQMRVILYIAWFTGLRESEIAVLKWSNIDMINNVLYVEKAYSRYDEGEIKEPKSDAGIRELPVSKELIDEIITLPNSSIYLFPTLKRKFISGSGISHKFTDIAKELGLKGVTFHSIRHTHATLLTESDIKAKAVQIRLGHSTADFTLNTYVHNTKNMQKGIDDLAILSLKK